MTGAHPLSPVHGVGDDSRLDSVLDSVLEVGRAFAWASVVGRMHALRFVNDERQLFLEGSAPAAPHGVHERVVVWPSTRRLTRESVSAGHLGDAIRDVLYGPWKLAIELIAQPGVPLVLFFDLDLPDFAEGPITI